MNYCKPINYNTLTPYKELEHTGIEYGVCRDFGHISRYKGCRQVVHNPHDTSERYIALETTNPISSNAPYFMYEVPMYEENRLDLIAKKFYGSAQYSWVLSYYNGIEDGFTVYGGQKLRIFNNFTDLFAKGELLASIPAMSLNLGYE